jgi:ATP-dependent RNA helicase DHX33
VKPHCHSVQESLIVLFGLEALDHKGNVTSIGREMSNFPLDPPLARALLASKTLGCTSETLIILSVLSASSKLLFEPSADKREEIADARSTFRHSSGDHLTLLNVVRAYGEVRSGSGPDGGNRGAKEWCARHHVNERAVKEAERIEKQLKETCRRVDIDPDATCGEGTDAVLKSLLMGIFQNCAILQPDGTYRQTLGRLVCLNSSCNCIDSHLTLSLLTAASKDSPIVNIIHS